MNQRFFQLWRACFWFVTAVAVATSSVDAADARLPLPSRLEQDKALAVVKGVFVEEYASKDREVRQRLAGQLFVQSGKPGNDHATQFVLLKEAVVAAAQVGDVETALSAAEAAGAKFQVDAVAVKAFALGSLARSAEDREPCQRVVTHCLELVSQLVAQDRFDDGAALLSHAEVAARRSRDTQLVADVRKASSEFRTAQAEFQKVAQFAAALRADPTDPQANLQIGKYECFVRGDWRAGLPMLALASDETLQKLAARSLRHPQGVEQRLELANDWWDAAENRPPDERKAIRRYTANLYRELLPLVEGLAKVTVQKRIAEASPASGDAGKTAASEDPTQATKPRVLDMIPLVDMDQDAWPREKWKKQKNVLQCIEGHYVPKVTLPYEPPAEYDVLFVFSQPKLRHGVGVVMPNRQARTSFIFGVAAGTGDLVGFSVDAEPLEHKIPNLIRPNVKYSVVVQVREQGVQAFVNRRLVAALKTDYSNLRAGALHRIGQPERLAIYCDDPTVFYSVQVKEVSEQGRLMRPLTANAPAGN